MSRRITTSVALGAVIAATVAATPAGAAERTVVMRSPAFRMQAFQTQRPKVIVRSPATTGYITRMYARMIDSRGRPLTIQHVMLHHVVFINQGRFPGDRRTSCGPRFGEPFYGTGEEHESLRLPKGYGYRIRKGDRWKMQTMLMSHQNRAQTVRVEYRMRIVTGRRLTPVSPYWVRVTHCRNDPSYTIPGGGAPGEVNRRTNSWVVPRTGRIVAAGSHLHGGSFDIDLRQPACGNRQLLRSVPAYAPANDLVYRVKPALHEPGPFNTSWFLSRRGVSVHRGERLKITALYDAVHPHPGVMGVMHLYIAPPRGKAPACAALPRDVRNVKIAGPKRTTPPVVRVPLTTIDRRGRPITLPHPPGAVSTYASADDRPIVNITGVFSRPVLSIAAGTTVTWRFKDSVRHKVSTANGPRAFGSATLGAGHSYSYPFQVPGTYQVFCYLHPISMHEEIVVRPGAAGASAAPAGDAGIEGDDFY